VSRKTISQLHFWVLTMPILYLYLTGMGTIQDAQGVLAEAEASLRQLIEQAMREQRYADVSEIAGLAEGVSRLLQGRMAGSAIASDAVGSMPRPSGPAAEKRIAGKPRKGSYPRFVREGDMLVKIGWSKKSKLEYEHRAPFDVANTLLSSIRLKVRDGQLFPATEVFPLSLGADQVPDYQAYLALKWLHSEGVVTKHGRDRYAVEPGRVGPEGLRPIWSRLPTTRSRGTT